MSMPTSPTYQVIGSAQNETKLCIIIDSKTPIIMKVQIRPGQLTLGQFKNFASLNDANYKFYFKSHDSEFGVVKEELVEDDSILPVDGDRVVAWVISNSSAQSHLFEPPETHDGRLMESNDLPSSPSYANSRNRLNFNKFEHIYDQMQQCVLVRLILDNYNFLGLTIVSDIDQSTSFREGIYVKKIVPNSVADRDGRIKVGDKIVEINGIDLRGLETEEAVAIFKGFVDQRGAINLVLERNHVPNKLTAQFNGNSNGLARELPYEPVGFDPMQELPIPIFGQDEQTKPMTPERAPPTNFNNHINIRHTNKESSSLPRSLTPRSLYTTSNFDNITSSNDLRIDSRSVYESTTSTSIRQIDVALHCGKDNIYTIYAALRADAKSLDIKDREWLKVTVKNAFLGSVLVKWLSRNVYGFCNKSEVKRYANQMLSLGLIRSPMSSSAFSEKCYYTLT